MEKVIENAVCKRLTGPCIPRRLTAPARVGRAGLSAAQTCGYGGHAGAVLLGGFQITGGHFIRAGI